MPRLRFETGTSGTIYLTLENSEVPFKEGEEVAVQLRILSMSLFPNEKISNIVWRGQLEPIGQFDLATESMVIEIRKLDPPSTVVVRWPADTKNTFHVFTTSEDQDPHLFETDPSVIAKVIIQELIRHPLKIPPIDPTWFAILVPVGERKDDIIISNVELIE